MILSAPSSKSNPLLCAFLVSVALISSLDLRASWVDCSMVSTYSSMLMVLNLVIFGLAILYTTSSQSWVHSVKISSLKLS
jgi:hypothetical protein